MYMIEEMVDKATGPAGWKSQAHRKVAITLYIGNPRITTMEQLSDGVRRVNNIPMKEIKTVTMDGLSRWGITL